MTNTHKNSQSQHGSAQVEWWQDAVIYQIYPRSFKDSNGDGVGDIQGIIAKLDYIASLNVDAIWISPIFKSPMKDFGYDIADYRAIDPLFGTLEEFDQLIQQAHALNIKVIIDQVLSHTSDQHPWFLQSREDTQNEKSQWYVWADAREDGTPPNNWLSIFGGPAWQWEPRRKQYYLHNFLSSQPDLNFHHPEVQTAVLENIEFWLKRGVDGLRLDAINFCFHDQQLRDNPPKPEALRTGRGFSADNPYAYQYHWYNNTQTENLHFVERIRQLLQNYPGSFALGEICSEDSLASMAEYTAEGRLHSAYSFELLTEDFSAKHIRHTVQQLEQKLGSGWPCWAMSNHDVMRVVSRWGANESVSRTLQQQKAKMLLSLLFSLRGTICCYQGEELGLTESQLAFHELRDPYGIAFWPHYKSRDNCRTPMPWQAAATYAGFSEQPPWLPVDTKHASIAVDIQEANPSSVLHYLRKFLAWRKQQPALRWGEIEFIELNEPLLGFYRTGNSQRVLAIFNLSAQAQSLNLSALPGSGEGEIHTAAGPLSPYISLQAGSLALPAYTCWFGTEIGE